jgi:hypothetical protein
MESLSRASVPCTKFAQILLEFSSSSSSQLHGPVACWTQVEESAHRGQEGGREDAFDKHCCVGMAK